MVADISTDASGEGQFRDARVALVRPKGNVPLQQSHSARVPICRERQIPFIPASTRRYSISLFVGDMWEPLETANQYFGERAVEVFFPWYQPTY